jgi:hypothetical protein
MLVVYLRDLYAVYCYSVSMIVMLRSYFGVLVSFLCAACSHVGCFMPWCSSFHPNTYTPDNGQLGRNMQR